MGRDMFQRSNVERVVEAACEHLNSLITNPKHKVDSQKVLNKNNTHLTFENFLAQQPTLA